jgi:pimeloyl-ACP methyl ester carboxylesterase
MYMVQADTTTKYYKKGSEGFPFLFEGAERILIYCLLYFLTMENYPLLLLHGALGSKSTLEPLKEIMAKEFTVFTIDFIGHGLDDRVPVRLDMDYFVDDVLIFMEQNKLTKVSVFGYSMGGYVALKMAAKYPERIFRIMTLGTKFNWTPESALHETRFLDPQKIKAKVPTFAETLRQRHMYHNWEELIYKTAQMMLGLGNGESLSAKELGDINCPVKIMVGDQDNMVSADESQRIASQLNNASCQILLNTTHPLEQVYLGSLANVIREFLD